jgi:hypothetical protein
MTIIQNGWSNYLPFIYDSCYEFKWITNQMQQFSSLLSWRLFTARHFSGIFPPTIRSSMTAVAASGFTSVSWWQSCCVPARPRTQHDCHHDTKVKPEAATSLIELLMMGGKMPETCWDVNERQHNKLENCCIWFVIYLNCTMMHGLTNVKSKALFVTRQVRCFLQSDFSRK